MSRFNCILFLERKLSCYKPDIVPTIALHLETSGFLIQKFWREWNQGPFNLMYTYIIHKAVTVENSKR